MFSAKSGKGGGWAPSATNSSTGGASGHGGNSRTQILDPRSAPPLAPARKVTPVDCSKPIPMDGGNLTCR